MGSDNRCCEVTFLLNYNIIMKRKLICNAIIVNEGCQIKNDILIEGDKIIEIKPNITPNSEIEIIEARGLYILPGLIDDQVHFREPGLRKYRK